MARHKPQIDGHQTKAKKPTKAEQAAMKFLKRELLVRGLRDALRRIITDWEVSHDARDAIEHGKVVLAEAQEELK